MGTFLLLLILSAQDCGNCCKGWLLDFPSCAISEDAAEGFTPPNEAALVLNTEVLTTDVGTVETWSDTSGAGNDQSQATAGERPTTTGTVRPNGWVCARFDATDDEFDTGGPTLSGNYRAFALAYHRPDAGGAIDAGGNSNNQIVFAAEFRPAASSTYNFVSGGGSIPTGWNTFFAVVDYVNDTVKIWHQGVQTVDATGFTDAPSSQPFRAWHSNFAFQARDMCRMLAWDSATPLTWTAQDVAAINDHLAEGQ